MTTKTFEIRDRMTFIPVIAIQLKPECEEDRYLIGRAGFGTQAADQAKKILMARIDQGGPKLHLYPSDWNTHARTMPEAHKHIIEHWDELKSGDVIDVEFVLGESKEPKKSERL